MEAFKRKIDRLHFIPTHRRIAVILAADVQDALEGRNYYRFIG
jgi:hypothetical protein